MKVRPSSTRESDLRHWSIDLQRVFATVGKAMGEGRLAPETLARIPGAHGSVLVDHDVTVTHVSGKDTGHRRGHYVVVVKGPRIDGRWTFRSGELERLSRLAA
jgi:hypothetical protein